MTISQSFENGYLGNSKLIKNGPKI